jgi:stage IV sporulation protein FB
MPYGAVIDGDLTDITLKDEILVALAGPFCNVFTAFGFAALWWFYPTSYAYTDTACFLSLSVALVNLLPAYPLDGGRILKCALTLRLCNGKTIPFQTALRRAEKICVIVTLCLSFLLLLCFFLLAKEGTLNYSVLGFVFFLVVGSFSKKEDARYLKIGYSNLSALSRGVEVRRVAVLNVTPLKSVLRYFSQGKYLLLEVYDKDERLLGEIRQSDFFEAFKTASIYTQVGEILKNEQKHAKNVKK